MRDAWAGPIALMAVLVCVQLGAGQALSAEPLTREKALEALKSPQDVEARRLGAASLGPMGRTEDLPLLQEALRDPDPAVRALAERSIYGLIYLQLDRPELALQYFERAFAANPNMPQIEIAIEQLRQFLKERERSQA